MGGTTGLGLSAARACVGAGAKVFVCGRDPRNLQQAITDLSARAGSDDAVRGSSSDATDPRAATEAIDQCVRAFGRFDALYHVAGGSGRRFGDGPLHQVTDAGIDQTLRLNLNSAIYSARAGCQAMLNAGTGGSILLMGSVLGFSPSPTHFATHVYAATKSAVVGLVRSCAAFYARNDIRFNVIAPALVETPMAGRAAGDEQIRHFIRTKQPLDGGRIGRPEDLDDAVVWLLSEGSRYVTGQTIVVDGGWSVSEGQLHPEHPR